MAVVVEEEGDLIMVDAVVGDIMEVEEVGLIAVGDIINLLSSK